MENPLILSIDQGTSSTKTIIFDSKGNVLARAVVPLKTYYLSDGFVEQDAGDIYKNVIHSVALCLEDFAAKGGDKSQLKTCGISNQRETFVLWDEQGLPFHNAVVWQCKRSIGVCERLKRDGLEELIKTKTGLIIDPYFSATKLIWLKENEEAIRHAIDRQQAYFGTVDTWLLYKLTNGEIYATDHSNASRTLLFNINDLKWDEDLIQTLGLKGIKLPAIKPSAHVYGTSLFDGLFAQPLSIAALVGDSHAAAFGEGCSAPGTAKATLGTGCSVLMNIGGEVKSSKHGMITTICWSTENRVDYALEGIIVSCGATLEWIKSALGMLSDSKESENIARSLPDNNGVYIIPAFSGLGAPHWDMKLKASIEGLTFNCSKDHFIRAALESIAYQVKDVIEAMQVDAGRKIDKLMINGGITSNKFVMEFLAALMDGQVWNGQMPDVSALGAAYLAGLGANIYASVEEIQLNQQQKELVEPGNYTETAQKAYEGWQNTLLKKLHTA